MKHVQFQREELEAQILKHRQETAPTRQPSTVRATTPSYIGATK